jgi:hypothetical protein
MCRVIGREFYAVGALDMKEIEAIIMCDRTDRACETINVDILKQFPERFQWINNPQAMELVNEELAEGPFNFIVLFFRQGQ